MPDDAHKCGSKRRNHKCGIGLCSPLEDMQSELPPKKKKLEELNEDDKNCSEGKKLCKTCGRSIQGHPLPKGKKCKLIPLPQIHEINQEQRKLQLQKKKE